MPLCYASLVGTHNSGISLADGYGNLDLTYQHYFRWISWLVRARLALPVPLLSVPGTCARLHTLQPHTSAFLQASDAYLQTNNQYLSLTDQMNLGVRIVELDTHFFDVSFVVG